jgi:putative nucleotidyltransferase with HDIG domain
VEPAEERAGRPRLALSAALLLLGIGAASFGLASKEGIGDPLFFVLVALDIGGSAVITRFAQTTFLSASLATATLAAAFLGPSAAFLVAAIGQIVIWALARYRWRVLFINLAVTALPALAGGLIFHALVARTPVGAGFLLAIALIALISFCSNVLVISVLMATLDGFPVSAALRGVRTFGPAVIFNIAFIVTAAGIYGHLGYGGLGIVVLVMATFAYMLRLVTVARERTKQYANLSWGVLSGLVRTLDERDSRAARHCAAVARFSRDIAAAVGMDKREQELAHTAGLLHDIGKFTLSDRVMERGGRLTDADWRGIRRHPEIGAMLLKDLGVYGPVAEIVRAHHERIDGRGYPDRLTGDQIPELAKIVAVAEVYDTLTAPDTYRTPMNSFEALNELRRVAGAQLDERYVEVLAELLAGKGTEYRHADEADFDAELDIERRMNEAAAP